MKTTTTTLQQRARPPTQRRARNCHSPRNIAHILSLYEYTALLLRHCCTVHATATPQTFSDNPADRHKVRP